MEHNVLIKNENYKDLNPVLFGYEDCEKSHKFGPAVREHWLIHFVESGFGIYRINGKEYRLGPGDMFIIPPKEVTYYEADSQKPWSYIWIGFTAGTDLSPILSDTIHKPEAYHIFSAMKQCESKSFNQNAFLLARLWDLFVLLLENKPQNTDYIEKALNCINSEYMTLTIENLAKRLNLNRSYFSTLFKKRVGISPEKYLLNLRMSIAASLMTEQGKSVSVAANSVGYPNLFNFSKMFKRHYGLSPTAYIKQNSNQGV